jgi:transposase-like protein
MAQSRRRFKAEFKAKVVLEALKERETIEALAKKFELSPNQISTWKALVLKNLGDVFSSQDKPDKKLDVDIDKLYSQIGKLQVENDFLKKKLF